MASDSVPIFPTEVWASIARLLALQDLSRFNQTCKSFKSLSTSILYRIIPNFKQEYGYLNFKNASERSRTVVRLLVQKPDLVKHIRHLTLFGANIEEDESVHEESLKLLAMPQLKNLRRFEFVYTDQSDGGWFDSKELLKNNPIWIAIKQANLPNLRELTVLNLPFGSAEHVNSLHELAEFKRIVIETHEHQFEIEDDPDEEPYTIDLFEWLINNKKLVELDLRLRFDEGPATSDVASVATLLKKADWPEITELTLSGSYCHDFDSEEPDSYAYGPSEAVHTFFKNHPGIKRLSINACPHNDFAPPQTVPLSELPDGVLQDLEFFVGFRNHIEDLGKVRGTLPKLKHIIMVDNFTGIGWPSSEEDEDEESTEKFDKFGETLSNFPALEVLELDTSMDEGESKDQLILGAIADNALKLKRLILRDNSVLTEVRVKEILATFSDHQALTVLELRGPLSTLGDVSALIEQTKETLRSSNGSLKTVVYRERPQQWNYFDHLDLEEVESSPPIYISI